MKKQIIRKGWAILVADNIYAVDKDGRYIIYQTKKEALKEWAEDCIEKVRITTDYKLKGK